MLCLLRVDAIGEHQLRGKCGLLRQARAESRAYLGSPRVHKLIVLVLKSCKMEHLGLEVMPHLALYGYVP